MLNSHVISILLDAIECRKNFLTDKEKKLQAREIWLYIRILFSKPFFINMYPKIVNHLFLIPNINVFFFVSIFLKIFTHDPRWKLFGVKKQLDTGLKKWANVYFYLQDMKISVVSRIVKRSNVRLKMCEIRA